MMFQTPYFDSPSSTSISSPRRLRTESSLDDITSPSFRSTVSDDSPYPSSLLLNSPPSSSFHTSDTPKSPPSFSSSTAASSILSPPSSIHRSPRTLAPAVPLVKRSSMFRQRTMSDADRDRDDVSYDPLNPFGERGPMGKGGIGADASPPQLASSKFIENGLPQAKRGEGMDGSSASAVAEFFSDWNTLHEVYPRIYLTNYHAVRTLEKLQEKQITHIVNCAAELSNVFPNHFKYKKLHMQDTPSFQLKDCLVEGIAWIDAVLGAKSTNRVVVHCAAGSSRSAALCIAYIMYTKRMPYMDAFRLVKSVRAAVAPNSGFVIQLFQFEKGNYSLEDDDLSSAENSTTTSPADSDNDNNDSDDDDDIHGKRRSGDQRDRMRADKSGIPPRSPGGLSIAQRAAAKLITMNVNGPILGSLQTIRRQHTVGANIGREMERERSKTVSNPTSSNSNYNSVGVTNNNNNSYRKDLPESKDEQITPRSRGQSLEK